MLTLLCVVVGEGRPFSVKIAADQSVGHLKDKIKGKIDYDGDAKDLDLYLAKTGGAWLDTDGAKAVALDEDGKVAGFDVMNPTFSLTNPKCIGVNFERKDGDIHVLVVVPKGVRGKVNNQLQDFDEWLTDIMTCSKLPDLSHLVEKVSGPLRIRIPIANPAGLFAHLNVFQSPPTQSIDQVFQENAIKHCPEVMKRIQRILFDDVSVSTTKESFIGFWDNIILQTLLVIFQRTGCSWDRTSSNETSTLSSYGPDFIFRLLHVCVFRGEEERSGEDQEVPRQELIDKLVWTYGEAPYLFGYSVCGFELRLHAILPPCKDNEQKDQGRRPCKKPRMPTCSTVPLGFFHLDTVCGRLDFRSLVNISPYLLRIAKLCPRRNRPEYTVCSRRQGASMRIKHLKLIYATMKQAGVPNVDTLIGEGSNYVLLSPVGDCLSKDKNKDPENETELLQALESVLEALVVLHSIGWMHRDIRWPNVLKQVNSSKWFLIDFDDSSKSPRENSPHEHLSRLEHPAEVFEITGLHTTSVDIWGVGYLILSCKCSLSETLVDLGESLVDSVPNERPMAVELLETIRNYKRGVSST
ncbi:hypothetical protein AeMF1_021196 [Aphanomyces euteiches]|nr:hypothetical protein AeMF1_021196 [Aphanomyces euteiches]